MKNTPTAQAIRAITTDIVINDIFAAFFTLIVSFSYIYFM